MILRQLDDHSYLFWCPGCEDAHVISTETGEWTFNNDLRVPKFHPSYYQYEENYVCHLFITDGQLLFLPDCTHDLAEKTVNMPNIPDFLLPEPETVEEEAEITRDDLQDGYYYPSLFDLDDEIAPNEDPEAFDDYSDDEMEAEEGEFSSAEHPEGQNVALWDENDG